MDIVHRFRFFRFFRSRFRYRYRFRFGSGEGVCVRESPTKHEAMCTYRGRIEGGGMDATGWMDGGEGGKG